MPGKTPPRQQHPRAAFSIAIRFLQKNRGAFFPEISLIDFKMKNGDRFFRNGNRSRVWLRFGGGECGAVVMEGAGGFCRRRGSLRQ